MTGVVFAPLLPWAVIAAAAGLLALLLVLAAWRGLTGWALRALAGLVVVAALANPLLQHDERAPLSDIVLLVLDRTASQQLGDRASQTAAAVRQVRAGIAALPGTELREIVVADDPDDGGTRLMTGLAEALAEEPRARIAGVIAVTDGQVHDIEAAPSLPAPLHVLLTGHAADWDRRLVVQTAPAFAIMGEEVTLVLRVEDQGRVPAAVAGSARLSLSLDGGEPVVVTVPVGADIPLPVRLPHGGVNVIEAAVAPVEGELTDRNNAAVISINGVRDRLRVLLVSGEPHAGERTWRNLLKSDAAVDLVHFTILRPPDKQDGVPVDELSLIAFPTHELFVEKIRDFDLIIFDRYRLRGILPSAYFDNIRAYVEAGGAVLVAAGPEYATVDSLWRSPLRLILPAAPTGRVDERPFRAEVSDLGRRHPVTAGLEALAPRPAGADGPGWGRWFRHIEVTPQPGSDTVMEAEGEPLLVLSHAGEGRVALLASDQAWLWARGYEGGGPQLELLRRLAHWLMKEPELEEDALTVTTSGQEMTITRRALDERDRQVTITAPDGTRTELPLAETAPGRWQAVWTGPDTGLYRLSDGELSAVAALGPSAPREFEQTIATDKVLAETVAATRGGILRIEDGLPAIRRVAPGRVAAGRGWIGITPRDAAVTTGISMTSLTWPWLVLLLAAALTIGAWLTEGRRPGSP